MDVTALIPQVAKAMGVDQKKLTNVVNQAKPYLTSVQNRSQATKTIQDMGIPQDFIDSMLSKIGTPKGKAMSGFAQMMGVDVQQALREAQTLGGGSTNTAVPKQISATDPLESLKMGLKRKL